MSDLVPLKELITSLEYGTKLHVSVWCFAPISKGLLSLDFDQIMHTSPFCDAAKARPGGYARCIRCKKWANEKARNTRRPFGGFCIHGIYEYCVPVEYDGQVVCIVYVGNFVPDPARFRVKNAPGLAEQFFDTVESSASKSHCRRVAETVASYIRLLLPLSAPSESDRSGYLVRNLKHYADTHYLYEIHLSQLAEIFHYNEKYIGRIFKKEMGISFRQYVNQHRLDYAKNLLSTTDDSILEVALCSGFNNISYFNRIFKERFSCSPKEFRSMQRLS